MNYFQPVSSRKKLSASLRPQRLLRLWRPMRLKMLLRSKNPSLYKSQVVSVFSEVKETIEVIEVTEVIEAYEVIEASEVIRVT